MALTVLVGPDRPFLALSDSIEFHQGVRDAGGVVVWGLRRIKSVLRGDQDWPTTCAGARGTVAQFGRDDDGKPIVFRASVCDEWCGMCCSL